MRKVIALLIPIAFVCGSITVAHGADKEEIKIKENKDGSYKMKVKRKGNSGWVGFYEGREYPLRGDIVIRDEGDYTVYGTFAPDRTYITTTRVEPVVVVEPREVVKETVTTTTTEPVTYRMRVSRHGDAWVGVHEGRTYVLHGDSIPFKEEGDYEVKGRITTGDRFNLSGAVRINTR